MTPHSEIVKKENNLIKIFLETNHFSLKYVHCVYITYQDGI